jgi:hypothetical protein
MPVNEMRGKRTTEDRLMCLKKFAWREAADFRYFQSFLKKGMIGVRCYPLITYHDFTKIKTFSYI